MLIGIVGKPSSGKSSFLNALTKSNIAKTGNYPFTTLKPNIGVGYAFKPCVCKEMEVSCGQCINNLRPIPIKIVDVAGLVPGASQGKGMGNQFLSDLAQADLLLHVVDCSGSLNEEGEDVEPGSHNPMKDILFLENEIDAWVHGILAKDWNKVSRTARSNKIPLLEIFSTKLSGLKITKQQIKKVLNSNLKIYTGNVDEWNK
jgi:ribosome-binding ATPase YchF (GTP1/OBG family)